MGTKYRAIGALLGLGIAGCFLMLREIARDLDRLGDRCFSLEDGLSVHCGKLRKMEAAEYARKTGGKAPAPESAPGPGEGVERG